MATTIDNLRVDHRITVLRDFTDIHGVAMQAGDTGILRVIEWDQLRMEIILIIERDGGPVRLVFALAAKTGPRNGRMRDFFELGEDVTPPRILPAFHDHSLRQMIVPPPTKAPEPMNTQASKRAAQNMDGPDRLEEMENEMRRSINHIGVAASIAEVYAQRMRVFQRAGNEPRAIAAFKLAVEWMNTYAGWATSGGEGAALSYERDQFQKALAHEFGYDPTDDGSPKTPQCHLP